VPFGKLRVRLLSTQGHFTGVGVGVQIEVEVGRRVEGVDDIEFVTDLSTAVIQHDGEMQVHAHGFTRCAGEVALIAEQGACLDRHFAGAGREVGGDGGIAIGVRQVGVIGPDLAVGLEGIAGDADDDGRFPVRFTGEVAVVGGIYRGDAHGGHAEDVNALVVVSGTEGIVPQVADEATGGHLEGGVTAVGVGLDYPFRHVPAAANPAHDLDVTPAVAEELRAAEPEVGAHQHDDDAGGEEEFEGFGHAGDYNRFGGSGNQAIGQPGNWSISQLVN